MRINPGIIGQKEKINNTWLQLKIILYWIGVNAGSLEKEVLEKYKGPCPDALVESAMRNIKLIEERIFLTLKLV